MTMFQLLATPLTFVVLVLCMGGQNLPRSVLATPFIRGAVAFIPSYAVLMAFESLMDIRYTAAGLYIQLGLLEYLIPLVLIVIGLSLGARRLFAERSTELFVGTAAFVAGFLTIWGLLDVVYGTHYPGIYELFLRPATRLSILLLFPAYIVAIKQEFGARRIVFVVLLVALPFLLAPVAQLFYLRFFTVSVSLTVAVVIASVVAAFFLQDAYFRSYL